MSKNEKNWTDIVVIIDRSGSMSDVTDETIKGFNSFLADQKALGDNASMTLITFNQTVEEVYRDRAINYCKPLTTADYKPNGYTALLDAVGKEVDRRLLDTFDTHPIDRAAKVVYLIITDGLENASKNYKLAQVKLAVERAQRKGWIFSFMGANMDAFKEAASLGINPWWTTNYRADMIGGTQSTYTASSALVSDVRKGNGTHTMVDYYQGALEQLPKKP